MTTAIEISDRPTVQRVFELYDKQDAFLECTALYRGFVGGRGSGKSKIGAFDLMTKAKPDSASLVGSPTGVKLRDETFPTFKEVAQQIGFWPSRRHIKMTPYPTVTLTTGAEVRFRTMEDPEKARGPNLLHAWLDEGSLMPEAAFKVVVGCLRDGLQMGRLTVTFTPKGRRHWTYKELATGKPNTALFKASTWENPFISPDFAKVLRSAYTRMEADQEIEGMFLDAGEEFQIFPEEWLRIAMARWKPNGNIGRRLNAVGFDVARGGECDNVVAKRYGSWFAQFRTMPGKATPTGKEAAQFCRESIMGEEHALINVDTFGVGADAYGELCRLGLNAASVNGGVATKATDSTGKLTFANLRSFGIWSVRELLNPARNLPEDMRPALPPDDRLLDEMLEHRWRPVGGQVHVEKKEDIAARLGWSPDLTDALWMSILLPPGLEHAA